MNCFKQGVLRIIETFMKPSKFLSLEHDIYANYLAQLQSPGYIHALPPLLFVTPIAVALSRVQYQQNENPTWLSKLVTHICSGSILLFILHFAFLLGIVLQEMIYCTTETLYDKLGSCQKTQVLPSVYWHLPPDLRASNEYSCFVGPNEVGLLLTSLLLAIYLLGFVHKVIWRKNGLPPCVTPSTVGLKQLTQAWGGGLVTLTRRVGVAMGTSVCIVALQSYRGCKDKGGRFAQRARDGFQRLRRSPAAQVPLGAGDAPAPDDLLGQMGQGQANQLDPFFQF